MSKVFEEEDCSYYSVHLTVSLSAGLEKEVMEGKIRRRLDSICRHLSVPSETQCHDVLFKVETRGEVRLQYGEVQPVVVGGMILDIHATPSVPANPRTTTPGKVNYALGGVARNVAECMSKLGTRPYMISALGLDMAGNLLLENWKSARLPIEGIRKDQNIKTPVVCNILDVNGELATAVASVEAIEKFLTPDWIKQFKCNISSAPVLMVDANLNPLALEASCQIAAESNTPVWFEPVSVTKSRRIASVVKYVTFASPNEDELIEMANALSSGDMLYPIQRDSKCSAESLFQNLKPAIWVLLEKGIEIVIVTLGSHGVFLCSKGGPSFMRTALKGAKSDASYEQLYKTVITNCPSDWFSTALEPEEENSHLFAMHFPAIPASVVKLTGAGDCLVGGMLASICAGLDVMQSLAVGIAAARTTVESEMNVPQEFNFSRIADDAISVYSAARVVFHQSVL